jgi:hypothetical protein
MLFAVEVPPEGIFVSDRKADPEQHNRSAGSIEPHNASLQSVVESFE